MESSNSIDWVLTAPDIDLEGSEISLNIAALPAVADTDSYLAGVKDGYREGIIQARKFFKEKKHPLLQCIDCRNTESTAGAMARAFNQGRCLCGGYFKVIQA